MRVVFGILFTAVVLIVLAHLSILAYYEWHCYRGGELGCMMIKKPR